MSDPLSIAAGIVGVLTAATQISSLLIKWTKSVKTAPRQALVILTEMNDLSVILSQLQSFILGNDVSDASRTSLLKVEQVVTVVSGCVLTFSELEELLDNLGIVELSLVGCLNWVKKEPEIMRLIQRPQNHKASLSLMLNITNGLASRSSEL